MKDKEVLICECQEVSVKSEKGMVLNKCKCKTPRRKEREYESVIVDKSD